MSGKRKLIKDIIDVINVHLAGKSIIKIKKVIKKIIKKQLDPTLIHKIKIQETERAIDIITVHEYENNYKIEEDKKNKIMQILSEKFDEIKEERFFVVYYMTVDEYHNALKRIKNNKSKTKLSEKVF